MNQQYLSESSDIDDSTITHLHAGQVIDIFSQFWHFPESGREGNFWYQL